jgi:hypothetical protein
MVLNDNYFSTSKQPFTCNISNEYLPGNKLCTYGDLHNHSIFSQSHVEFGPPLKCYDKVTRASGLSFIGITDHSYDLACNKDNYLIEDQSLTRWKALSEDLRGQFETMLIQGEEISCLNSKGLVVHLGGIGIKDFITGTLDGARRNSVFPTQLTISQAIEAIQKQGGIAFAAHPGSKTGFLQQLFLYRGIWSNKDPLDKLDGFQALNSGFKKSWAQGKAMWIEMLRKGFRVPLLGGNDAHGDFNRNRALSIPFLRLNEGYDRFMGFGKTGIYGQKKSHQEVLEGIGQGATFVTNGPYVSINLTNSPDSNVISNKSMQLQVNELFIHAISNPEFGRIKKVTLITGSPGGTEKTLLSRHFNEPIYEINEPFSVENLPESSYIRAEVTTALDEIQFFEAYTSALFLG